MDSGKTFDRGLSEIEKQQRMQPTDRHAIDAAMTVRNFAILN